MFAKAFRIKRRVAGSLDLGHNKVIYNILIQTLMEMEVVNWVAALLQKTESCSSGS
jgi:hypothetical protein